MIAWVGATLLKKNGGAMKKLLTIILFFMLSIGLFSQGFSVRFERNSKKESKIKLLKIKTTIYGMIAETEISATIFNPYDRTLEGELVLPLPEGAFLSNYALDIKGVMVDGVIVKKKKARIVFEEIVRKGIDPGLAELVSGNNFKTRIFPFSPKGTRRIRLKYISKLNLSGNSLILKIPLAIRQKVGRFELKIQKYKNFKTAEKELNSINEINFSEWGFFKEFKKNNYIPPKDINISIPYNRKTISLSEHDKNGRYYFLSSVYSGKNPERRKRIFRDITILWDSSLSMDNSEATVRISFLNEFLLNNVNTIRRIRLIVFNKNIETKKFFGGGIENIKKLITYIKNIKYDGATSLKCLDGIRIIKSDVFLLFTDGITNYDENLPRRFSAPLYIFSNNRSNDYSVLNYLAKKNGGEFFDLSFEKTKKILRKMGKPVLSLLSIKTIMGKVSEIYPILPFPVKNPVLITGRLLTDKAMLELNFGYDKKVVKKVKLLIKKEGKNRGKVLKTFWAQNKLGEFLVFKNKNRELIEKTGMKYGLMTPFTSMLVLDSLEQYLEYEIVPPKTFPVIYKRYIRIIRERKRKKRYDEDKKIEEVLREWRKKVKWWETDFNYKPKKIKKPQSYSVEEGRERLNVRGNNIVYGFVRTEDNNPLPGVIIILKKIGGRRHGRKISDEQGFFRFDNIESGCYEIKAELEGFKTTQKTVCSRSRNTEINLTMRMGALHEEITVESGVEAGVAGGTLGGVVTENRYNSPPPARKAIRAKNRKVFSGRKFISEKVSKIKLKRFDPEAEYIEKIKSSKNRYEKYLKLRKDYFNSPAYYMDCADYFVKIGRKRLGLKILSNLLELSKDEPHLLRIYAYRLEEYKRYRLSEKILKKVLKMRDDEPQSYRDLALVKAKLGKYYESVSLLYDVIRKRWRRFDGIELIALMEMNDFIRIAKEKGVKKLPSVDKRLIKMLDVDLRIVLTWDTNDVDIDLWVIEPYGEKVYYGHELSKAGGRMSKDFTNGYGPEEYMIKKALKGKYVIKANYYGNNSARMLGPVTLKVSIFTNYGRKNEKEKVIILRLKNRKQVINVGKVWF